MSNQYVKSIIANGVHGRFNIDIDLFPGVNIIHGKNGTGKTTLMHILANALNGEFERFVFLDFDEISLQLDHDLVEIDKYKYKGKETLRVKINGKNFKKYPVSEMHRFLRDPRARESIAIRRARQMRLLDDNELSSLEIQEWLGILEDEETETTKESPPLLIAYFPAFRTMLDAWASTADERELRRRFGAWSEKATASARQWFGNFVPLVNYPSLLEIERRLTEEINQARLEIGRADRELLSQAFLQIFTSLLKTEDKEKHNPDKILKQIRELFDRLEASPLQEESTLVTKVYAQLRESIQDLNLVDESEKTAVRVLNVYSELLEKVVKVQEESFLGIQEYLESVNEFFDDKKLVINQPVSRSRYRGGAVGISFKDGLLINGLRALSSGERQIVTLIYAATHMSKQKAVLIDEPEISLHVDWQRRLLKSMSKQIGERQIIASTHSPVIAADYPDNQIELVNE